MSSKQTNEKRAALAKAGLKPVKLTAYEQVMFARVEERKVVARG